jgi:hypothetical protein
MHVDAGRSVFTVHMLVLNKLLAAAG